MTAALAMLQETTFKTPDTAWYAQVAYAAIALLLASYLVFLWIRVRKTKQK